jgi:hypothetical protein
LSITIPVSLSPGSSIPVQLPGLGQISVVDFANSSPFDITYVGFGCPGEMIIEAGTKVRLHAEIFNAAKMTLLPVNNVGASGTGVVNITVYFTTDNVPPGTFPVAIPVQVVQAKVTGIQTLSNENQTTGTLVVDIGPSGNNQVVAIFNDHFVWSVVQSGVAHQVLKGQTSGNPLQIGQSGDITEVLGKLTGDGTSILTGAVTAAAANVLGTAGNLQHILGTLTVDQLVTDSAGLIVNGSTNPTIDISSATGTAGIKWQGGKTTTRQTSGFNAVTTTGTAITHGLGAIPSGVSGSPSVVTGFSVTAIGATTFTVTVGANCNFSWIATVN